MSEADPLATAGATPVDMKKEMRDAADFAQPAGPGPARPHGPVHVDHLRSLHRRGDRPPLHRVGTGRVGLRGLALLGPDGGVELGPG